MTGKTASFLLFLLVPAFVWSGQKQEVPRFRVAVNLVTLDVVVLDRDGKCPEGLRAEDFEIFENGVRQEILDFERIAPPRTTSAAPSPAKPQPPIQSAVPAAAKSPGYSPKNPRLFLLVFDELNSSWENLARMKPSIEAFVTENIKAEDMMAVVRAGHSIQLLQSFTNDRQALLSATRKALGLHFEGEIADADKSAARESADRSARQAASGSADDADEALRAYLQMVALYSQLNDEYGQDTLRALKALCERLAPLKGRKTMVLVSEGFALTTPVSSVMAEMVGAANKANISIYCLNPRGLSVRDLVRAESNEQSATPALVPSSRGGDRTRVAGGNSAFDMGPLDRVANAGDDGLDEVAMKTGGLAVRRTNDYQNALTRAYEDNHSFYQMTYNPTNPAQDNGYRKISVRLTAKGYTVRARDGYYASPKAESFHGSADEQMAQALASPQLLNQLSVAATTSVFVTPSGDPVAGVAIHWGYPGSGLVESEGRYSGTFSLAGGIFSETGTVTSSFRQEIPLDLDEAGYDRFRNQGTSLMIWSRLPPGKYETRTVLREKSSGRMGTTREGFEVPAVSDELPSLSSIVVSSRVTSAEAAPKIPLLEEGFNPFLYRNVFIAPSARRIFAADDVLTFFFHVYQRPSEGRHPLDDYLCRLVLYRDSIVSFRSDFTRLGGTAQPIQNGLMMALQMPLSRLAAGSYRGEIEIVLPDGSSRVTRSVSFEVR